MKTSSITLILLLSLSLFLPAHTREVLSWVPPYSVDECYDNLNEDFGTYSPKNVLTGLALQFWRPTNSGGVVYEVEITDDIVNSFREKCTEYGINLLLCLYNNDQTNPGWDWNLAHQAFKTNKTNLVNALYDECKRLNLDGVDIDLEGLGGHDDDRDAFALFIKELGDKLHDDGLLLTVDSFHSPCYNAPNMAWWEDWVGYVDYIHTMGYSAVWESNNRTLTGCPSDPDEEGKRFFKYSYQSRYGLDAGLDSTVVSAGLPSSSSWGDGNVRDHLQDILDLPSPTGICIWDFTINGSEWRKSSTWEMVKQIRDLDPVTPIIADNTPAEPRSLMINSLSYNQIKVTVAQAGRYSLSLYNASGRLDRIISNKYFSKGIHTLPLINSDRVNGVYILRITGEGQSVSQKIVISK